MLRMKYVSDASFINTHDSFIQWLNKNDPMTWLFHLTLSVNQLQILLTSNNDDDQSQTKVTYATL